MANSYWTVWVRSTVSTHQGKQTNKLPSKSPLHQHIIPYQCDSQTPDVGANVVALSGGTGVYSLWLENKSEEKKWQHWSYVCTTLSPTSLHKPSLHSYIFLSCLWLLPGSSIFNIHCPTPPLSPPQLMSKPPQPPLPPVWPHLSTCTSTQQTTAAQSCTLILLEPMSHSDVTPNYCLVGCIYGSHTCWVVSRTHSTLASLAVTMFTPS